MTVVIRQRQLNKSCPKFFLFYKPNYIYTLRRAICKGCSLAGSALAPYIFQGVTAHISHVLNSINTPAVRRGMSQTRRRGTMSVHFQFS